MWRKIVEESIKAKIGEKMSRNYYIKEIAEMA